MAIADLRKEYRLTGLRREDLAADPVIQFRRWFDEVLAHRAKLPDAPEANAMNLSTVDAQGRPSARIVLLKGVDERGFVFFTNYESRKGVQLAANPHAALVFHWADLERQVCIGGVVEKVSREESSGYFHSRPRGSQLAAWASPQSQVIAARDEMEARWKELEAKHAGQEIPLPSFWGGYVLKPERVEFWQGRPSRLHDRFVYSRSEAGAWEINRLSP